MNINSLKFKLDFLHASILKWFRKSMAILYKWNSFVCWKKIHVILLRKSKILT